MSRVKLYGALVLVQVFFGIHYFAAKILVEIVEPRAWAAIRILGAGTLVMAYNLVFVRRHPRERATYGRLALYAVFGVVFNQILFVEGMARTTPSHSAIINSLIPVATLGIALLARTERLTARRAASILIAFASVLVLLRVESFRLENQLVLGDLLTLGNAGSFALFLVLARNEMRRLDPWAATSWLLVFGAVGILSVSALPLADVAFTRLPARFFVWGAYAIVCATVLAYFLNFYALQHVESSTVALFVYLQAPIATLLSIAFLNERPETRFWIAAVGIFAGVFLAVGRTPSVATAEES
jgi:drug/metabolite transporter (DMT)-like permease